MCEAGKKIARFTHLASACMLALPLLAFCLRIGIGATILLNIG